MSDETRQLADQAADAIRALHHLTRVENTALEFAGDLNYVLASLRTTAELLPQVLADLASRLMAESNASRQRHDGEDAAQDQFGRVITGLAVASAGADQMAAALAEAASSAAGHC